MARTNYTPEFKSKLVLEVLQGEKELNGIAAEHNINPNMLRNWKKDFLANSSRTFDENRQVKEARRKEEALKKENERMLKTIGQLTLERNFLQDCFRITGTPLSPSDQGCQFTSAEYKVLLKHLHITQSMDGKSRQADNIMIERWFHSLKTEGIYLNEYETPRVLRQAIRAYVQLYNTVRSHQALENCTPEAMYYASFPVQNADLDGLRWAG